MASSLLPANVRDLCNRLGGRVNNTLNGLVPTFVANRYARFFRIDSPLDSTLDSSTPDPYASRVHLLRPPPAYHSTYTLDASSVPALPLYSPRGTLLPHYEDIELAVLRREFRGDRRIAVPVLLGPRTRPADRNTWSLPEKSKKILLGVMCAAVIVGCIVLGLFLIPKMGSHRTPKRPPPAPQQGSAGSTMPPIGGF